MKLPLTLSVLSALFVPALSLAASFPVPDVAGTTLIFEEKQYIKDRQPPTEVLIRTYKKADGRLFRVYSIMDAVFRYDIDENGASPYEYRLIDSDGDGVFDTKERLIGEMAVQEGGQKYYIDLGPEPGKEYRYSYEERPAPEMPEKRQLLMGYPIYIPQWVLVRFNLP